MNVKLSYDPPREFFFFITQTLTVIIHWLNLRPWSSILVLHDTLNAFFDLKSDKSTIGHNFLYTSKRNVLVIKFDISQHINWVFFIQKQKVYLFLRDLKTTNINELQIEDFGLTQNNCSVSVRTDVKSFFWKQLTIKHLLFLPIDLQTLHPIHYPNNREKTHFKWKTFLIKI